MSDTETELAHYGKKGMKWGKRKASSTSDSDKSAKPAKKKRVDMTQDEKDDADFKKAVRKLAVGAAFMAATSPTGQKVLGKAFSTISDANNVRAAKAATKGMAKIGGVAIHVLKQNGSGVWG